MIRFLLSLYKPKYNIHFIQRTFCNIHHILTKFILCFVNSRCIYEHNLTFLCCQNSLDTVSCCLWFV